jgi:hypothetical protein
MSGVAQYLSDKTLCDLLSLFPKVLLQEDVALNGQLNGVSEIIEEDSISIFSIYHERDGSFVRSEKYFEEEIFGGNFYLEEEESTKTREIVKFDIVGKSDHFIHGCCTKTWALKR